MIPGEGADLATQDVPLSDTNFKDLLKALALEHRLVLKRFRQAEQEKMGLRTLLLSCGKNASESANAWQEWQESDDLAIELALKKDEHDQSVPVRSPVPSPLSSPKTTTVEFEALEVAKRHSVHSTTDSVDSSVPSPKTTTFARGSDEEARQQRVSWYSTTTSKSTKSKTSSGISPSEDSQGGQSSCNSPKLEGPRSHTKDTIASHNKRTTSSSNLDELFSPTGGTKRHHGGSANFSNNLVLSGSFHDAEGEYEQTEKSRSWRSCFQKIVAHERFEMVLAALILANALLMCLEVQYMGLQLGFELQYSGHSEPAEDVWLEADRIFLVVAWFFGIVFTMEVVIKSIALDSAYVLDAWSWLDIGCVLIFWFDKVASNIIDINEQFIKMLRLFRLIRLVRLLRSMEGLSTLYLMTTAIKEMRRILMWAIALLSLMLMMCALFLTQVLHVLYFDSSPPASEKQIELYVYFGTFTRSMFSMFELTLANYPPAARLLAEEVSEWFMLASIIHKLTIGFAVVGVINGVIFQETLRVANTNDLIMVRAKKRALNMVKKKMTALFQALDQNGDGSLDFEEFEAIASHPEVKTWLSSMDVETNDLKTLYTLLDEDNAGEITIEQLIERVPRLQGTARSIDLLALKAKIEEGFESVVYM